MLDEAANPFQTKGMFSQVIFHQVRIFFFNRFALFGFGRRILWFLARPPALARLVLSAGAVAFCLEAASSESEYQVTVKSGKVDRRQSIVSFDAPPKIWNPELIDKQGNLVAAQLAVDGQIYFILDQLAGGQEKTFRLRNQDGERPMQSAVWAERQEDTLRFTLNGKTIAQYQAAPSELPRKDIDLIFRRGGYLHPLWSPSGLVLTDDYPPNHLHHHGVWTAWPKTKFQGREPNFWEMGRRQGTVEFEALDNYWSGEVMGGFRSRHRLVDLSANTPIIALQENWEVKIYAIQDAEFPHRILDLKFTQKCAANTPIHFPQYRYGGLGFRGHRQWDGAENAHYLTGLGETDRIQGHATRAPWCHIGGQVNGQFCGVAILCHPKNFRAPQPMRIHPKEPFFCYAPSQIGEWEIVPGKPYISQYRFILADGKPDKTILDRLWQDYAQPVSVLLRKEN